MCELRSPGSGRSTFLQEVPGPPNTCDDGRTVAATIYGPNANGGIRFLE